MKLIFVELKSVYYFTCPFLLFFGLKRIVSGAENGSVAILSTNNGKFSIIRPKNPFTANSANGAPP